MAQTLAVSIIVALVLLVPAIGDTTQPIDFSPIGEAADEISRQTLEQRRLDLQQQQLEMQRQRQQIELERQRIELQKKQMELEQMRRDRGQERREGAGAAEQPLDRSGNWVSYAKGKDGSAYYYDSLSLTPSGDGQIRVISKRVLPGSMASFDLREQDTTLHVHCARNTLQMTKVVDISQQNTKTARPVGKENVIAIQPNSIGSILMNRVCK